MKKILLLGSGELGKEFVIAAKRLGLYVVACDAYAGAPAMQVADECEIFSMLDGEALAFYEKGERAGTVPLAPLERVFLRGDVLLHANLLGKLGEKGVGVVVLTGRKAEPSLLLATPHNDASRRIAQFRMSQDPNFCLRVSKKLMEKEASGIHVGEKQPAIPANLRLDNSFDGLEMFH